jgi:hypothetical protein
MPAQVLVMCAECSRPQFATQKTCVSCGAVLPDAPMPREELKSVRDRIIEAQTPFLEATLGRGQRLCLSEKQLEWHGAPSKAYFALPDLKGAKLQARPVWETLIFGSVALIALVVAPWLWLRLAFAGLVVVAVLACFIQRRFFLLLATEKGTAALPLGIGARNAPISQRIQSIWGSLRDELERRGVPCEH